MVAVEHDIDDEIEREAREFEAAERRNPQPKPELDETMQAGHAVDPWEHDERRYRLGIDNIDRGLKDRRPADFIVIGGIPGGGKTSLAEQAAVTNAVDGKKVIFGTFEMIVADIENKIIGRELGADLEGFERHRRQKTKQYTDAVEWLRGLPLRFYRPPDGQGADIRKLYRIAERSSADVLIIDYAALLNGWSPGIEAKKIVQYIAAATKSTGICTILLAQIKQELLLQRNRRPTMADLEDTRALGQASTTCILLHRPFLTKPKQDVVAEVLVVKNRKGAAAFTGHTHWYGATQSLYTMDQGEEERAPCCYREPTKSKMTPSLAPAPESEPPPQALDVGGYHPSELEFNSAHSYED